MRGAMGFLWLFAGQFSGCCSWGLVFRGSNRLHC